MPREENTKGTVETFDLTTERGKLVLARQYIQRLHKERQSRYSAHLERGRRNAENPRNQQTVFPTPAFRKLRERIGYVAGTQYNILKSKS